jgi:two-component system chemotaxis sensor kinase CheA
LPFVKLADVLEIAPSARAAEADSRFLALVLGSSAMRVAFEVDEIQGDREVLVKPLGRTLERVRNVLGATVLADVGIAPILNIHDLLKSALRVARAPVSAGISATPQAAEERRVLIVEDSITARGLLKNILEAAGYQVKAAVDGAEAWALLCLEPFDVVVSDVEMPRMNGFDLTARIRADRRLAELPVVLVTALDSREDRERGVDVGANAYIVKRDFDQKRLFEVLQRLS